MKKTITLVLTVVLVLAMAVPVFAIVSPKAPVAAPDKTTALPEIVDHITGCLFYSVYEADALPEAAQEEFKAAQGLLKEAAPEKMTSKYFFYHVKDPTMTGRCQHSFNIGEFEEVIVMLYVDGEWVELEELGKRMDEAKEVSVNSDGTITITGLETASIAFFTK